MKIVLATANTDLQLSLGLSLSAEPGIKIAGTASEVNSLRALIENSQPKIVVVDTDLPEQPVYQAMNAICQESDLPKWILLSSSNSEKEAAIQAGANAFVLIGDPPDSLLKAFRQVRASIQNQSAKPLSKED